MFIPDNLLMNSTLKPNSSQDKKHHPQNLRALFWALTTLSLQGFGGVLPVAQRVLVEEKHWLTPEQFVEEWAIAQIMPGPNVVNLTMMIGHRFFGLPGAITALAGMLIIPTIVVVLIAVLYTQLLDFPAAVGALKGMGAVSAGLIIATGLKLLKTLRSNPVGIIMALFLATACFLSVAIFHFPLGWVILILGAIAWRWCFLQIKPSNTTHPSIT